MPWKPGQSVVRREVLHDRRWLGTTVFVVADQPDLLWSSWSPPAGWEAEPLRDGWDVV